MRYVSHWPSLTPLLFLAVYLPRGTRLARGFRRLSAYTRAKVRGTLTPATAITADSNSCSRRGAASAAFSVPTSYRRASNSFAHTLFTDETGTPGTNGEPPERAA